MEKKFIVAENGNKQECLKVSVDYNKGGWNVWHGKNEGRGIYVYCNHVTIEDHGTWRSEQITLFDNRSFKVLVKELSRKSDKQLAAAWSKIEPNAETIFSLWKQGNNAAVGAYILSLFA